MRTAEAEVYHEGVPSTVPLNLRFNEAKAAQAAARLLRLHGGKMNYMKLIKLLYLTDRESLKRWGRPVTTDCYVSMDKGPVLSAVLDLINNSCRPGVASPWYALISEPSAHSVSLLANASPPDEELSRAEEDLIDEIYATHGCKSQWALVDLVHELPEWKDPGGSAIPIAYADILRAVGKDDEEIDQINGELRALKKAEQLFA